MKNILLILFFLPLSILANDNKTISSSIETVTVYQQGAQIERQAYYSVKKGLTKITIENISRQIDAKSIQVLGTGDMVILDAKYKLKYPEPLPSGTVAPTPKLDRELQLLEDSVTTMSYELFSIEQRLSVLNTQKSILSNNGAIKGVGKVNDSIPLLMAAMNYYYEKMNAIDKEVLTLTIQKNRKTNHKNNITKRINEIYAFKNNTDKSALGNQTPISCVEITISANAAISGKINLTYMVSGAGWIPLYDINSNTDKSSIALTYKAQVYQNTGVNWMNANLTLSTNNPYTNKTKPNLSPYYLHYFHNGYGQNRDLEKDKKSLNNMDVMEISTTAAPRNSAAKSIITEEKESAQAYDFVQLTEQLISVEYEVNLPYSIISNNEQHLVLIRQETVKSDYKYYTVPKLDASAYLVAELNNLDELNLIAGKANIFHDGAYIGETKINPSIMADSLALSLGKDQNIQVKRTLLKQDSKTRIMGDKTIQTFAYLIEVKNHKSTNLDIIVQDQIPVTQDSDIEIVVEEDSKGKINDITGIVDWLLKLKPKETKTVKLIYTVTTEKHKQTNLAS